MASLFLLPLTNLSGGSSSAVLWYFWPFAAEIWDVSAHVTSCKIEKMFWSQSQLLIFSFHVVPVIRFTKESVPAAPIVPNPSVFLFDFFH
jgi:hypothetical protein